MTFTRIALAAALAAAWWVQPALAQEDIAKKAGCTTCHTRDKKLIGPTFEQIAAKYKSDPGAVAKLSEHVRKGSKGVWGPVPMPPNEPAKIGDADLKTVVGWILKP